MRKAVFIIILLIGNLIIAFTGCNKKKDTSTPQQAPILPTVSTSTISWINQTTAICGGTVLSEGSSPVTARGVCWDMIPGPTILKGVSNNGSGVGTYTSQIWGLYPGMTCYVRAYATNAGGTTYGAEYSFTTLGYWTPVTPVSNSLTAYFLHYKNSKLLAVTPFGSVIASIDSGYSWNPSSTGITGGVSFLSEYGTKLFAGGNGGFFISNDNGNIWTAKNTGLGTSTLASLASGTMGIFAGTTNGIFLTFDSGDTWGPSGLSSEYVSSLAVNGGTVFAGTMGNGLFVSINDGATWVPVTNAPTGSYIYQVVLSGSNMIVSCINGNLISTDNGLVGLQLVLYQRRPIL
ncbi:MAG: hypothetical protein IPI93_10980 [Sphingobacteriaceae bacterium]|nr:hypothetical protein [Sphingobacteriaceae bacterium]